MTSFVLDCEIVAYLREQQKILPFQVWIFSNFFLCPSLLDEEIRVRTLVWSILDVL